MNKYCWITGASKGIGRATALTFAKNGYHVIASARSEVDLHSLKEECEDNRYSGKIIILPFDVTNANSLEKSIKYIFKNFGNCNVIIFNAGTYVNESSVNLSMKNTKLMMDLNFNTIINSIIFLKPFIIGSRIEQIIAVSSIAGWRGMPHSAIYSASKSALKTAMESFCLDFAKYKVKFKIISPGFVDTPLTRKNNFKMPFLMDANVASTKIFNFVTKSNKFETSFPLIFSIIMKILTSLPWKIYRLLINRKIN